MLRGYGVAVVCGLTIAAPLRAQVRAGKDTTVAAVTATAPANAPTPLTVPTLDSVFVTGVRRLAPDGGQRTHGDSTAAGLGDIILVSVSHLKELVQAANCKTDAGQDVPQTQCRRRDIALYLDGREIPDIKPESGAPIPEKDELRFHLTRSDSSDEAWADLLGNPPFAWPRVLRRPTEVSVGLAGEYALASRVGSKDAPFDLIRFRKWWLITSVIAGVLLVGAVVRFAQNTTLLRDKGPVTNGAPGDLPPYSLGRVQMAFWFVLVVISFVNIWLVTNGWDTINGTVLALIGIGTGTALGASLIDGAQNGEAPVVHKSRHFIPDILTDGDGYAFHRFQMAVWTLVLGVLFLYSVWQRLAMPEFSATLLGLLGISGGTYLGFKIPETPGGPAPAPRTSGTPTPTAPPAGTAASGAAPVSATGAPASTATDGAPASHG
jgi:hypothetical protein